MNVKVAQLARWTQRDQRTVNLEVNRRIGVRTRRRATEEELQAALRYVQELLNEAVSRAGRDDGAAVRAAAEGRQPV